MSKALIGCGVAALGLALLVALMVGGVYNNLVGLQEGVDEAWGQVENVYQRRADLIPNLVATVKGAADFEQETLQNVVEARAKVGQMNIEGAPTAAQMQAFQANQDALSSALSRLLVVVERYPELKAVQAFQDLQVQLEGTENRIAVESSVACAVSSPGQSPFADTLSRIALIRFAQCISALCSSELTKICFGIWLLI